METNFFLPSGYTYENIVEQNPTDVELTFDIKPESSRSFNKGKSFNFSEWNPITEYTNDAFVQDFVMYNGDLYVCWETNINCVPSQSNKWLKAVSKLKGQIFVPEVDDDGNISWYETVGNEISLTPKNIRGNSIFVGNEYPENFNFENINVKLNDTYMYVKLGKMYRCVSVSPLTWSVIGDILPQYFRWINLDE